MTHSNNSSMYGFSDRYQANGDDQWDNIVAALSSTVVEGALV